MKPRTYTVTITNPEGEVVRTTSMVIYVERGGRLYSYDVGYPDPTREERIEHGRVSTQHLLGKVLYHSLREDVKKLPEDWGKEAN